MVELSRRQLLAAAALGGAALLGPLTRSLSRERPFTRSLRRKSASSPLLRGVFRVDNRSSSTGRMGDYVFLAARSEFAWPSGSTIKFGTMTIPAAQCTPYANALLFHVPAHLAGTVPVTARAGGVTSNAVDFTYLPSDVTASTGLYRGYGTVRVEEASLTHPVRYGVGYLGNGQETDWSANEPSPHAIGGEYRFWQNGGVMVWQTAMLPALSSGVSLEAGAQGAYDSHWARLATAIMTSIPGPSYFSIGWEYSNANYFPWGVTSLADALHYAAYYQRIVDVMRLTLARGDPNLKANVEFKFGWNFNRGPSRVPDLIETSYPGDAFVDVVGFDFYDSGYRFARRPDGTWADPSDVWSHYLSDPYSLDWLSQFAIDHGKAVGFPEWGLVGLHPKSALGGGDDPFFISAFSAWLAKQPRLAYHCYFDFDPLTTDGTYHSLQNFPRSAVAFKTHF